MFNIGIVSECFAGFGSLCESDSDESTAWKTTITAMSIFLATAGVCLIAAKNRSRSLLQAEKLKVVNETELAAEKRRQKAEETRKKELRDLAEKRTLVLLHRFNPEFVQPDDPRPSNDHFFKCDPPHTALFHNLVAPFFSQENLRKHAPLMREKARQLITTGVAGQPHESADISVLKEYCFQVFCEIFLGYQGTFAEFGGKSVFTRQNNENQDESFKRIGNRLLERANHDDPTTMIGRLKEQGSLDEDQIRHFITILFITTLELIPNATDKLVKRYLFEPDLYARAVQSLKEGTVDQDGFSEEILKVIVETTRYEPPVSTVRRSEDKNNIDIGQLAFYDSVVGKESGKFNADRCGNPSRSWVTLPWLPFGSGPHVCPGWRFYKYLAAEFVAARILLWDTERGMHT